MDPTPARPDRVSLPVACLIAGVASIAAAALLDKSALAISLILSVLCALGAVRPGASWRRLLCVNLVVLLAIFAVAEVALSFDPVARSEGRDLVGYTLPDERLSYAPARDFETTYRRYAGDVLVYDVIYSIAANGLRVAPPHRPEADECILFFGDSFMFGEGLMNEETLPYRVGIELGGAYQIHNFGFHGYGPHQMLAALELGVVDEAIACKPRFVVYQGAAFHIDRAAGLSSWEKGGPRFEPTDEGFVEYRGRWDPTRFEYPAWLTAVFESSHVLGKIPSAHRPSNEDDYLRYLGILETTRRLVETRFPGAEFHVVFWDVPEDRTVADLVARNFRIVRVSEILTDRGEFPEKYRLHELDGHPNALAMAQIAAHLAKLLDAARQTAPPGQRTPDHAEP